MLSVQPFIERFPIYAFSVVFVLFATEIVFCFYFARFVSEF